MCVYDEHPLAGRDIQYWAAKSWSKYTTDDKVGKVNYVILNQNDSCNCVTCKNNPGFQRSLELKMY